MYHIKNEKRTQKSAELIINGLAKLMDRDKYENLSITDIAEASGVGRATFYRLFEDKSDILSYQVDLALTAMYEHILPFSAKQPVIEQQLFTEFFDFWLQRKDLITQIIQAHYYHHFENKLLGFFSGKLGFIQNMLQLDNREWYYFIHLRIAMLSSALRVAVCRYPDDSAQDIARTLTRLFTIPLLI